MTAAVRPAIEADAAAIGLIHVASWRETYSRIMPDALLAELSIDTRAAMWRGVIADPGAFGCVAVFVAEVDGCAVGFASCGKQRDPGLADAGFSGEIGAVYVLRAHHGKGTGRSLMRAAAEALSTAGHAAASLWVLEENATARSFYAALGGIEAGRKTDASSGAALTEVGYGWTDLVSLQR